MSLRFSTMEVELTMTAVVVSLLVAVAVPLLLRFLDQVLLKPFRVYRRLKFQRIRGYPFRPIIGQLPELRSAEMRRNADPAFAASTPALLFVYEGCKKFKGAWMWSFGARVRLVIPDPHVVRQVFITKTDGFAKTDFSRFVGLLGKGLVTSMGELWARQRRLINPAFHATEIHRLYATMAFHAIEALDGWEIQVRAHPGSPLGMDKELNRLTLDIISATAFGMDLVGKDQQLLLELSEAFDSYFAAVEAARTRLMVNPWYKYLPTSVNRTMWRNEAFIRQVMGNIIERRVAMNHQKPPGGAEAGDIPGVPAGDVSLSGHVAASQGAYPEKHSAKTDLLQLMVTATEGMGEETEGESQLQRESSVGGEGSVKGTPGLGETPGVPPLLMSKQQLMDECVTFLAAGHETTGVLLTWTVMLVGKHPEWQERAREEVRGWSRGIKGWMPTYEEVSQLKLLTCILQEALRLHPPAYAVMRSCIKDTVLSSPAGTLTVPAGCDVFVPIEYMHRSEEYWGPDALEFNPLRFSDGISKASRVAGVYLPFGLGPRVCIGQSFAMVEAKLVLALLLNRFTWSLHESYRHHPHIALTAKAKYGLPVVFTPLEDQEHLSTPSYL